MSNIVVFGASGNTGSAVVEVAQKKGYKVRGFVRDSSKVPEGVKPDSIFTGDVLKKEDVEQALEGQDAVIIVLGTRNDLGPTTVMSEGTKNVVEAMKKANIDKVSACLSSFMFWEKSNIPQRMLPIHEDHERMYAVLESSNLKWIAVCPPHIENVPARGGYILENDKPVGRAISKYDLAEILVDVLKQEDRVHHKVAMGYPA